MSEMYLSKERFHARKIVAMKYDKLTVHDGGLLGCALHFKSGPIIRVPIGSSISRNAEVGDYYVVGDSGTRRYETEAEFYEKYEPMLDEASARKAMEDMKAGRVRDLKKIIEEWKQDGERN